MLTCYRLVLFLSVTLGSLLTGVRGHDQKIETFLAAKWRPTSVFSEAAEYIADIEPGLFWKFMDNVIEKLEEFEILISTDRIELDVATVSAFNLISPAQLEMMKWSITSRAYSPKVHMLHYLAPSIDYTHGCESFVQYGKEDVTCNLKELEELVEKESFGFYDEKVGFITESDHKYPSPIWNTPRFRKVILYGNPMSVRMKSFHNLLKSKSDKFGYIFRPYRRESGTFYLAGYGAELQFKSTEYVAQDDSGKAQESGKIQEIDGFIFEKLHELHPELDTNLDKLQNHLNSAKGKKGGFEALKAWQVQELGLQASYYSTLQENMLESLEDISSNFPSLAASLSAVRVPASFKKSIAHNHRLLQSHFNIDEGDGALFIQGNYVDPDSLDLFTYMDTLKVELDLMETLQSIYHEIDLKRAKIEEYLQVGSRGSSEPELALDLRDSSVIWINDLEKDEEYEDWPDDLTQLFFRMGGVMLRPVRRNVFNLLFTLDPEDTEVTTALLKMGQSFMAHKAPLRVGVVFCSKLNSELNSNSVEESRSEILRRVLNYALSEDKVKSAFGHIVEAFEIKDFSKLLSHFGHPGDEFDFGSELACEFIKKSGRSAPGAFLNGIPLKWESLDDFEEIVLNQLLKEAQNVQVEAYNGKVRDSTDIFDYLMNKPNVQTRLNDKILDASNSTYLSFGNEIWELGKNPKNSVASLAASLNYLVPPSKKQLPISITLWILADISSQDGLNFLLNSLQFLKDSSTHSRLAFIATDEKNTVLKSKLSEFFTNNDLNGAINLLQNSNNYKGEIKSDNFEADLLKISEFLQKSGIGKGGKGVIVNGRVIGPLEMTEDFDVGDWALVEKFSFDSCAKYFDDEKGNGDIPMRVCSIMSSSKIKAKNAKRFILPQFLDPFTANTPKDEEKDPFYLDIKAVVDPASRHAHKIASLLRGTQKTVGQYTKIQIIFNPPAKHSELPLKSYFRYISGTNFEEKIVFENIPRDPLFTQNLYAPDNWMVEVVRGDDDLDNIRLRDKEGSISSQFELSNLLVEGHCLEVKSGSPPRGLEFKLVPQAGIGKSAETIVMSNLGYFQLKAGPGVWKLDLRDGLSRDIFSLDPPDMKPILVDSFQSVVVKAKVKRNPGKETASLLESEESGTNNESWFGFGKKAEAEKEDTINVFSLASGHLYERLLKIMMLSVMKNTKSKVKFWFLKNYLSPTIKNVLPHLAKEYGFEYELVEYHWPRWLNPQREKQRIIWGYKILFLDVLFPLSLKKIVFVDADQIVRTDLKELFELDLEGNPYGYTPFCDSRVEMEGFRFWKHGYWRSHLGKRKYHISALYVVDLVRFRKVAAGDRLRGQYQALSQDPNSLSNLDQDLPNNMIHQVGIKSLPQEWLWCETWCDDASKAKAKTIDLCNNPQTKESKLEAAQRIVPEWKEYDSEIRNFQNGLNLEDEYDNDDRLYGDEKFSDAKIQNIREEQEMIQKLSDELDEKDSKTRVKTEL